MTHSASVLDINALYSEAEAATEANADNGDDDDGYDVEVPPSKRHAPDSDPAVPPLPLPAPTPALPLPTPTPPLPLPAPMPASAPAGTEPVARTLVQISGIGPRAAAVLGFDVYRLLDVGDDEQKMHDLLTPGFTGRPDELAVVVQNARAWVRTNGPRVAAWRAANPTRALPDRTRPSGWLQDVPGINPNLLKAAAAAARRGVGTLSQLHAYFKDRGRKNTQQLLIDLGYEQGKTSNLEAALDYLDAL